MIEASLHLKMADGSTRSVPFHWRESADDFARWAVGGHPDLVEIDMSIWCYTNESRRTPQCVDCFDFRAYDKEIDGPGSCCQDFLSRSWVKRQGYWWEVEWPMDCMYHYEPEMLDGDWYWKPRLADFIVQECPVEPPSLRRFLYDRWPGLEGRLAQIEQKTKE